MTYALGDCDVDIVRRELRRAGKVVHVEPQVFDLLVYLIRNRERVVSKDDLIAAVWDGRIVSDATLDSRISAARRAIGDNGQQQELLRTIARRGFRLVCEVREGAPEGLAEHASAHSIPYEGSSASPETGPVGNRAEKPSIAVLPLANLSSEPAQEYFADGVTEDLIAGLSRVRWLRVLSRSSSFTYKDKPADPKQISRELGVRYIVGGSIRRSGERLRINIELVDAANALQLWSVRYHRELEDIFEVQDEIAQTIVGAIEPELAAAEWARARQKSANSLDAWDQYRRGTWHLYRFGADDIAAAKNFFRAAISTDADFAHPYAMLAYASHLSLIFDHVTDRSATLHEGLEAAKRSVELDNQDSFARAILGRLWMMSREFDRAIEETEAAIELNPYSPQAHYGLGFALVVAGRAEEAIKPLLKAVELSPRDPNLASYGTVLATAYLLLNQPAEAVRWARIATRQPSSHFIAHMHLVVALAELDDAEGAKEARSVLLALKPNFGRDYIERCWPFKRPVDLARFTRRLQQLRL